MAEGKIFYHGSCESVLEFFESCGFRRPDRIAVADFVLEMGTIQRLHVKRASSSKEELFSLSI